MDRAYNYVWVVQLEASEDWEDEIDDIMEKWQEETQRKATYTICFY